MKIILQRFPLHILELTFFPTYAHGKLQNLPHSTHRVFQIYAEMEHSPEQRINGFYECACVFFPVSLIF